MVLNKIREHLSEIDLDSQNFETNLICALKDGTLVNSKLKSYDKEKNELTYHGLEHALSELEQYGDDIRYYHAIGIGQARPHETVGWPTVFFGAVDRDSDYEPKDVIFHNYEIDDVIDNQMLSLVEDAIELIDIDNPEQIETAFEEHKFDNDVIEELDLMSFNSITGDLYYEGVPVDGIGCVITSLKNSLDGWVNEGHLEIINDRLFGAIELLCDEEELEEYYNPQVDLFEELTV